MYSHTVWFILVISITYCIEINQLKHLESHQVSHLNRNKRQLDNTSTTNINLNKQYQSCTAPGNKKGHCKRVQFCPIEGGWVRYLRFVDALCVVGNTALLGICCPDDLIIGNPSSGANIVPNLPADGYERTDNNKMPGCGLKLALRNLTNNETGARNDWPWMAALILPQEQNRIFCGGVLITDQYVLTAAHCTDSRKPEQIGIRLGEYDVTKTNETRAANFIAILIHQHNDFDPATYDNDIAVIKLNRRTTFNSYIWPICLPPTNLDLVNKTATVIGWGKQLFDSENTSNVLMEVSMPIWDNDKCAKSFTQVITSKVLCAAGYEGGKDSCQGDSGGPLQYQLENGRWVNIGIVSWGIQCGAPGRPGVYTRVDKFLNWILDNTAT